MKTTLFCFGLMVYANLTFAQVLLNDNDAKVKLWQDKKSEYYRKTEGEYEGYRIKIHFGSDKTKAREIKSKFLAKFPDIIAYEEYQQPNFVILVGDYRSKPEAYGTFKKIQLEFPNAFIVKDRIRPPRLN